jgi:hypothetical protein
MQRDATHAWAGRAILQLPESFPIAVGAVGIPGAEWSIEIKISTPPPGNQQVADFNHNELIANNGLSIIHDTITLTGV